MALKGLGVNALRQRATEEAKVGNELIQQQLADACTGTPPLPAPVGLDPPTPKTRNPPTPTAGVGWGWGASPPPKQQINLGCTSGLLCRLRGVGAEGRGLHPHRLGAHGGGRPHAAGGRAELVKGSWQVADRLACNTIQVRGAGQ